MTAVSSPPNHSSHPSPKGKSGVVVPHRPTWFQRLGAWLMSVLLRLVLRTLRYSWKDPGAFLQHPTSGPKIFAFWHNRLGLCVEAHRVYSQGGTSAGVAALVSASRDGGFLSGILKQFGIEAVRGSSSRRGSQALLELTTWAERGYDLAITPDGPRGPRYAVQDGVILLSQLTGLAIVPFSYHARWKIQLKSWDQFQIPLPFTKCEMAFGTPLQVPHDATDEQRHALRLQLEESLKALSQD